MRRSYSDKIFDIVNIGIMVILFVIFLWPLWFALVASISDPSMVMNGEVLAIPKGITFDGYRKIMENKQLWTGYANTILYTVVGTTLNMVMSICLAYPVSDKTFWPRKILLPFYMFTMYFSGGLIPHYLLYKTLGIVNTRWAMIIPGAVSVYNSLIIRSYFMNSIPDELKEAATLDGASAFQYLMKVVLPLSKSVFAVVGLYYAVSHWNDFQHALYYLYKEELYPLQTILRNLLMGSRMLGEELNDPENAAMALRQAQQMQYGVIMIAAAPMLCIYPFVQKHFVKGVMVGSVKG